MKLKNRQNEKGMTIIEILVTLAIFGAILAVSVNLGKAAAQRTNLSNAVNKFVADYSYARMLASRDNRYVAIVFEEDGTGYSILVQRKIGDDLTQAENYDVDKVVRPMDNEVFFEHAVTTSFAVNSMGMVKAFPVNPNNPPITVILDFFVKDKVLDEIDYEQTITLFPTGGIKIDQRDAVGQRRNKDY